MGSRQLKSKHTLASPAPQAFHTHWEEGCEERLLQPGLSVLALCGTGMTPVTSAHPLRTLALKYGSKLEVIPEGEERGEREKGFLSFVPSGDTGYRAASVDSCKYLTRKHVPNCFPVPQPLSCHLK